MDNTAKLWSLPDGQLLKTIEDVINIVCYGLAINSAGTLLATAGNREIKLWSFPECNLIRSVGNNVNISTLNFHPKGTFLVSGNWYNGDLKFWSIPDLELILSIKESNIFDTSFNPDGTIIASTSNFGYNGLAYNIELWSFPDGLLLKSLSGHTGRITSIAINATGDILASGSSDKTVKLWNLKSGDEIHLLPCTCDKVCTCDTVYKDAPSEVCSCNSVDVCTCNEVCTCDAVCTCNSACTCDGAGSHYWYPV
jgi:WD40 repeat protein